MLLRISRLVAWGRRATSAVARELVKFGLVGAVAFVVDVGGFNLLRAVEGGPLADKPVTAKILSATAATLVAWAGNRWWTFRHRRHPAVARELVLFLVMNGAAMAISVLCLALSHYGLGLRSPLADNVSANVVGVALGTAFRFHAYRTWVFRHRDDVPAEPVDLASGVVLTSLEREAHPPTAAPAAAPAAQAPARAPAQAARRKSANVAG